MDEIEVRAPANVKIGGEHSVVYGGPSLSAAIALYATAKVVNNKVADKLEVILKDLNASASLDAVTLKKMHAEYHSRDVGKPEGLVKYIENNTNVAGKDILPYATIAARLFVEQGVKVLGKTVTIHSDVPVRQGYASSAVCSAAFTMALAKASGKRLEDQVAIDIIRDGERIVHKAETAGRIDVGPIYFGGFARFSAADGIKKEDISTPLNIVVIDTGPKPPTAEMVKKVRDLYNADTAGTTKTLKEIDNCVERATIALKEGNLRELGKLMSRNHELLNKLGVSSPGLDKAVAVAVSNGAYGAKLCGGGGGGMCIALVGGSAEADKVISALKAKGFNAYSVAITHNGANSNTSE